MKHDDLDCPKIRQHLALYAGRDLEEPLCAEVERHLGGCEACRVEFAQAQAARERIAVLGEETARALGSVDLWPALGERWARERSSAEPAPRAGLEPAPAPVAPVAPLASSTGSRMRARPRTWIPISLAAAAAVVLALRPLFDSASPIPAPITQAGDPPAPAASVASTTSEDQVQPDGALRRAAPGDERLRDSSSPLGTSLRPWLRRGAQEAANSLAGDNDLR